MKPAYYDNVCPQWKILAVSLQNHCVLSQKKPFCYLVELAYIGFFCDTE